MPYRDEPTINSTKSGKEIVNHITISMVLLTHCCICQGLRTDILWPFIFSLIFFCNVGFGLAPAAEAEAGMGGFSNKSIKFESGMLVARFSDSCLSPEIHFIWTVFPNCLDGWVPPCKGTWKSSVEVLQQKSHVPDRNQRRACGAKRLAIADAWCVSFHQ